MRARRIGTGALPGKKAVLATLGRGGLHSRRGRAGEKSNVFNRLQERLTRFPKEEDSLEEERTR